MGGEISLEELKKAADRFNNTSKNQLFNTREAFRKEYPQTDMTFDEYQGYTSETAVYPGKKELMGLMYCGLGAAGEAGEVANKIKKVLRDNNCVLDEEFKKKISKEMGGTLWYLSQLAEEMGTTLGAIARNNVMELRGRRERGTLHGDGDDR